MIKWIKNYINDMLGSIYKSMEDPARIQSKITELNGTTPGQVWNAFPGYNAITGFEFEGVKFMPASGVPVKLFINSVSGELKFFPATMFEDQQNVNTPS